MEHDRHWHYWGAGFLAVGVALLGIGALLVSTVSPPHPFLWTTWYALFAYGCFALAMICGVAAAVGLPFPLAPLTAGVIHLASFVRHPGRRAAKGVPQWRDQLGLMGQKQIARLEALEQERAGYADRLRRLKKGLSDPYSATSTPRQMVDRIRQVDEQIHLARDHWWEVEGEHEAAPPPAREHGRPSPAWPNMKRVFVEAIEGGLNNLDRDRAALLGDGLMRFWTERESSRPEALDQFTAGTVAKNARDVERQEHDIETIRLYHGRFAIQALEHVRRAISMELFPGDVENLALNPGSPGDIGDLAARLQGLRPNRR